MRYVIDGRRLPDFAAFVDETNRALAHVAERPWNGTLDALTDLLLERPGTFVLQHAEAARAALDHGQMAAWLETRVDFVHPTNRPDIEARLDAARRGEGPTLFDMLVGLIGSVPGLALVLE